MRIGHGTCRRGRWWLYFDTDHLSIGRTVTTDSVIYSVLGVVVEHLGTAGDEYRRAIADHRRRVARWQRIRDQFWRDSEHQVRAHDGESLQGWQLRRWRHTCLYYDSRAADHRARGEQVPSIDELSVWAPTGIAIAAYSPFRRD